MTNVVPLHRGIALTRDAVSVRMAFPEASITQQQATLWDQSRAKFLWECPGFAHILYSMMGGSSGKQAYFTTAVPVAATDGVYMLLNPDTWFKYKLSERVFIMAHEVCHAMLNHCVTFDVWRKREEVKFSDGTTLPYDEKTMQHAADYVINDMLVQSKIGTLPKDALHDVNLGTYKDQLTDAYRRVYKKNPPPPKGKGGNGTSGGNCDGPGNCDTGTFDQVLKPGAAEGKNAGAAAQERNEGEWKIAVASALEANRVQGKLPGAMQHVFGELLEPQISWQEHILGYFKRKTGSGSWNFRRPDRRLIARMPDRIYAPARSGFGAENVVVAIDTSGSIGDKTVDMFLAEVAGILEDVNPQTIWIMWCDAKLHRTDECEDFTDLMTIRAKGAPGRGGTDFTPVFDEVQKLGFKPDALVYLTDGYGTFPAKEPEYSVLWGDISGGQVKYPFGEVVTIPKVV